MDFYYFTDQILFNFSDKTLYFVNEDNTIDDAIDNTIDIDDKKLSPSLTKISRNNWRELLGIYGWDHPDEAWLSILDSYFVKLECGMDGDCFFHSLAEAININNIYKEKFENMYDSSSLRDIVCSMITHDNYDLILDYYKCEKESGEFQGEWDPSTISRIEDLYLEIQKSGNNFWADHFIIQLLGEYFKINIIILNIDEFMDKPFIIPIETKYTRYVFFVYEMGCHYQLLGRFNGKSITSVFNYIPHSIKKHMKR